MTPLEVSEIISKESLAAMDSTFFHNTELELVVQSKIRQHFFNSVNELIKKSASLHMGVDINPKQFNLHFRKMVHPLNEEQEMANAFALPSGDIIISDELIRAVQSQHEIDAILYHEIAHVVHKHGLKQLTQSTFVTVA